MLIACIYCSHTVQMRDKEVRQDYRYLNESNLPRLVLTDSDIAKTHDVSLVDGYNLPMRIDNNKGCGKAQCPVDLGPNCAFLLLVFLKVTNV